MDGKVLLQTANENAGYVSGLVYEVEDRLQTDVSPLVDLEVPKVRQVAGLGHLQQEGVQVLGGDAEVGHQDGELGQVLHGLEEAGQEVQ